MYTSIKKSITDGVSLACNGTPYQLCYEKNNLQNDERHFCFFLKPGSTENSLSTKYNNVLNMVFESFDNFQLRIQSINILSGSYLKKHRIIQQHYSVLYNLAENASSNFTPSMHIKFFEYFKERIEDVVVLGGFEFLNTYPEFTATSLDILWANIKHWRLGSGGFCGKVTICNKIIYIINGFTPNQLSTYTPSNHALTVFTLAGNLPWHNLRLKFLGSPDPEEAEAGSLRNKFLLNRNQLDFREVSLAKNGAHLSAGPVESLVELCRFTTDLRLNEVVSINKYSFGKKLTKYFSEYEIKRIMANPVVQKSEGFNTIFDLTDGIEENEAIKLILSIRSQL